METIDGLQKILQKFNKERGWGPYNSPKNIAMALFVETAELIELIADDVHTFDQEDIVCPSTEKEQFVANECADIASLLLYFCYKCKIDISKAILKRMDSGAIL